MPALVALAVVLLAILAGIALTPLALVLRYRAGTARRLARGWVVTLNVMGVAASAMLLLAVAALTSLWVPQAFAYTLLGLAGGCLLGLAGLLWSRWEATPRGLHYTPNRWLVLAVTLVVASRLVYGFWRGWHRWHQAPGETSLLVAFGAAGSLAAGAVVLGYYLVFWAGLWLRLRRHRRTSPVR